MFKIERKIVEFVERNVNILFILAITGLAIAVRYAGRDFVSGDMTWFLLGWFQKIADNGGIHSLKNQVGDYNILYQTIVALFTYIGDKSIYYYKILSIFFDFCMAISAAIFACELSKKEKNDKVFFITFAAVIMLPTVILNSAYWGQCDSIYTTFIILTLLYLYKGKYHSAFVFLGIAFAFKMQTIFIFPFIICFYIYKKQFSIFELLITVFTFWISGICAFVQGRSLLDPFRIYTNQTGTYQDMHVNFPSFWMFVGNDYEWLKTAAIVMAASICGMGLYIIMRLRALTGLEREKIEAEYEALMAKIKELRAILADENLLLGVIKTEIMEIADKYGDERRTSIGFDMYDISTEDLIPRENVVIAMTKLGYIKRMSVDNFKAQNRGGKGIKGMQTIEDDYIEELLMMNTHHYLMFFTNTGKVYRLKGYEIPEASRTARGTAIVNLLQLAPEEKITAMIPVKEYKQGKYLFMATRKGIVKKTPLLDYANVRKTGLAAISLREDDELIEVKLTNNKKDIFLVTKYGQCIRFPETNVRSMGRTAMGVIGMQLNDGDEVIGMQLNTQGDHLLIVSANGMGKLTSIDEFKSQNRGGKGVKCYKIMEKTGNVIGVKNLHMDDEIMMINTEGIVIRMMCSDISVLGRVTSGVKLMNLSENVSVASIAKVRETSADSEDIIKKIEDEMIEDEKNDEEIKNEETTQE